MSQTTTTPNYGLIKPNVNSDNDLWGDHWNANADTLDSKIKTIENKAGVVSFNTRSGTVSLLQADVTTVLPPGAGTPAMDGTASAGTLLTWSKSDHVHPTDTSRYAASNPAGYVTAAQAGTAAPVQSVATRTGAVVLTHNDLTDWAATLAPYAPLASPALTGSPTAPTASPATDSSTKLATTAFVQAAVAAGSVISFNTRTGAITLTSADVTAAGGALLASPALTGTPTAPTVAPSTDSSTKLATTGFVQSALFAEPGLHNIGRNLLHNPLFNVAQRGVGPWTTSGYTADRWTIAFNGTLAVNLLAASDTMRAQIGDESANLVYDANCTGQSTSGGFTLFQQMVEDVRRLAGKTITVSFYAIAYTGSPKLGLSIDQFFGTGGSPSTIVQGNGQAVTLSTTWTRYSLTFTMPSVAGKTLGTTANSSYTGVVFWLSAEATYAARSGNIGVQTMHIQLWGVQLEIGSVTTPLEKPDPRYDLANAQRFYQSFSQNIICAGVASVGGGGYYTLVPMPVTMRAAPTVVFSSPLTSNASALTTWHINADSVGVQTSPAASGVFYAYASVQLSADL